MKNKKIETEGPENFRYFRTNKEVNNQHADHNIRRWEWIDNQGRGRSYSEISRADSVYRQNIIDKNYAGNNTSINTHLINYDISRLKMIERKKIGEK